MGNVCVKRFMDIDLAEKLFKDLTRIGKDQTKRVDPDTIHYAHEHGWINDWEQGFYTDILRYRSLKPK